MKKVEDYLEQLGLTQIEAKIYQGLLKFGPTTVKDLADHVDLNRVTTHFQVNNLINKGLVVQLKKAARRQVAAETPERLQYLIEQKEKQTKQLRDDFPDFLKTLQGSLPHSQSKDEEVEVKYYKGKQGCQQIYEDVLKANEIRAYVNGKEITKVFPGNIKLFTDAHNDNKNMLLWEIMNNLKGFDNSTYSLKMAPGRYFAKYVPATINLSVLDYMIYDGKVAIVNIKENPTGMIIVNKEYYENAKAIFDLIWNMLPNHPS